MIAKFILREGPRKYLQIFGSCPEFLIGKNIVEGNYFQFVKNYKTFTTNAYPNVDQFRIGIIFFMIP